MAIKATNTFQSYIRIIRANKNSFILTTLSAVKGEIWIVETKGGFDRSGNSQDIDLYTPKKFKVLKDYLTEHGLKGGIVRNDAATDELCICMDTYSEDINSDNWVILSSVLE